jgi:hypothetical protein
MKLLEVSYRSIIVLETVFVTRNVTMIMFQLYVFRLLLMLTLICCETAQVALKNMAAMAVRAH